MAALTTEERRAMGRKAAAARWALAEPQDSTGMLEAKFGAPDRPLRLAHVEIPCYVLSDGTRVLVQRGLQSGLAMSEGGGKSGARKIVELLESLAEKGIDIKDLIARANSPIKFIPPHGGNAAGGYEATILPDLCAVLIDAGQRGVLGKRRAHLAERAALLQHAFATIGIIALVDEATGYQGFRPQDALQAYLDKVIGKQLAAWIKRFPDEFYENIYKLKGWQWPGMGKNRYSVVGHYTRDLVFDRLGPGILKELETLTPKDERGYRTNPMHSWLSEDIGVPMLSQHMHTLVNFQKLAIKRGYGWNRFVKMVDEVMPKHGNTMELNLDHD
jgi:hypothetical protein